MQGSFNLIELLKIIIRWRKQILITVAVAFIGSIIISDPHIMKPYFLSTSVFYPSDPSLTSSQNLFVENKSTYFGNTDDVDRVLAIANSTPLKNYIIHKYNLFRHYDIDSANVSYPNYRITQEFDENYKAIKNDKGGIEISVYDHDRIMASQIANNIVDQIDDINKSLLLQNKEKILGIYANKLQQKEHEISVLSDSIVFLRERSNSSNTINNLSSDVKASAEKSFNEISEKIKILEEKKSGSMKELNNNLTLYEQYKATVNRDVPTIYIIQKAYPAERKSKPIRWLIVLGATFIGFILSVIIVVMIERYKYLKAALAA